MTDYRCYFLRPATLYFGAPSSIDATENILAETDDQARLIAETLYNKRASHVHGFEVWQSTRLVHRHPGAPRER